MGLIKTLITLTLFFFIMCFLFDTGIISTVYGSILSAATTTTINSSIYLMQPDWSCDQKCVDKMNIRQADLNCVWTCAGNLQMNSLKYEFADGGVLICTCSK